jgi:hypothetical protein
MGYDESVAVRRTHSMTQVEIDRLSDQNLAELTKKLCQRVLSRRGIAMPLAIPGDNAKPIGFLFAAPGAVSDDIDPEFFAELRRRIANPPAQYLSVDEFLDALDDYWSKADAAGRQLNSANGHVGQAG